MSSNGNTIRYFPHCIANIFTKNTNTLNKKEFNFVKKRGPECLFFTYLIYSVGSQPEHIRQGQKALGLLQKKFFQLLDIKCKNKVQI